MVSRHVNDGTSETPNPLGFLNTNNRTRVKIRSLSLGPSSTSSSYSVQLKGVHTYWAASNLKSTFQSLSSSKKSSTRTWRLTVIPSWCRNGGRSDQCHDEGNSNDNSRESWHSAQKFVELKECIVVSGEDLRLVSRPLLT